MTVAPEALIRALKPIYSRVRRDVTAVKYNGRMAWTRDALNLERMTAHVTGGVARGVCPIEEGQSVTRLGLLDFDSHGGETPWPEMVAAADRVADELRAASLEPIAFRSSGGRGLHIFVLWDEPQDAYNVRQCLTEALGRAGFTNGARGVSQGQVEVFPKQDTVGPGEFGNQFILPLAGASEPLDIVFGFEPMGREAVVGMPWPVSAPVAVLERPVRERAAGAGETEPVDKLRQALFAIPNDGGAGTPDYDQWRDLCFAVHEASGGSQDGLDVFLEWSAQNPRHDEKFAVERVWDYIKPADVRSAGGITRGTLYHLAGLHGWSGAPAPDAEGFDDVPQEDVESAREKAQVERRHQLEVKHSAKQDFMRAVHEASDEIVLREDVCRRIRLSHMLEGVDREMLADAVKQKLATFGGKVGIAACRKLVAMERPTERTTKTADWTEGWVYITDSDKFHRIDSEEYVTAQGFNAKFNRMLPPAAEGEFPKTAHRVALDEVGIPTVTRSVYLPWCGPLFEMNGVSCVNMYRPSSTPVAAEQYTPAGRAAIELVRKHIMLITGQRKEVANILLSWMAYNVQNPGRKIRWSPLVKGIQGDGKTLIGRVLVAAMGEPNVKDISPKVLGTDFTGWAHGACVGVLEEIRLTGHNRYDIYNALKPYITNNSVAIHAKGQDEFTTVNTMNYVAFTNFADALPLNDDDRRFFVVFTPFSSASDLHGAVGDVGVYFTALYDAIEQNRAELRKWFLELPIAASFDPNGRAPITDEKSEMVGMNVSQEEDAVTTAIEQGGIGITPNVVIVSYLRDAARQIDPEAGLDGDQKVSRILQKLGWTRHPKQVKWNGKVNRVWYRGLRSAANEEIHGALDASKIGKDGNSLDPGFDD